jgi:hypothetical protein
MKEPQRGLEVVDGRVAGRDDRNAPAMMILHRGDEQRARFDRCAGDVESRGAGELSKEGSALDARAEIGDQGVVAIHSRARF